MLNTVDAISNLLQGTILEGQAIRQIQIDESKQWAFLLDVDRAIALDAWKLMRSLLEQTQRYPILSESWGSEDYFSRFYYEEEHHEGKLPSISPEEILASASIAEADLEGFLEAYKMHSAAHVGDLLSYALEETEKRFGIGPTPAQIQELIDQKVIFSVYDLEKWIFNWELEHFGTEAIAPTYTRYLDWYEPDGATAPLILLPTAQSWPVPAYLHWYGACTTGTPVVMRFLQQWQQKYNAELVCHYGTMLQFNVGTRPQMPEEAFELAWQQVALAECTTILPGVSLRDHARSLLVLDRWFLHERP